MARFGTLGKETECINETNHHPAGGIRAVSGNMIANFPQVSFNVTAKDVTAHRDVKSEIRRAITSSPSALSPAFSDAIRSAMTALNSETCARLRFVSATRFSQLGFYLAGQFNCHADLPIV